MTYSGAAHFLGGFLPQTPSLSLAQTMTPYQFLDPYNIILPQPESFGVDHFISIHISLKMAYFESIGSWLFVRELGLSIDIPSHGKTMS